MIEKDRILLSTRRYVELPIQEFLKEITGRKIKKPEVWAAVPWIFTDAYGYENLNYFKKMFKEAEVEITCYRPAPYGYALYAGKNSFFRKASLEYYYHCIGAAEELEASVMAIDLLVGPFDQNSDIQRKLIAEGLSALEERCWNRNISLVWKFNRYQGECLRDYLQETRRLYELLGNSKNRIGIEMDLNRSCESKEMVSDWFNSFKQDIWYITGSKETEIFAEEAEKLGYSGFYGQDA